MDRKILSLLLLLSIFGIPDFLRNDLIIRRKAIHNSLLRILHTLLNNPLIFPLSLPKLPSHPLHLLVPLLNQPLHLPLPLHKPSNNPIFLHKLLINFLLPRQLLLGLLQFLENVCY